MKKEMDDNQILLDYKSAADQKEQVQILAQLNGVGVWEMATWLKEHGADINLTKFTQWNPKWKEGKTRADAEKKEKNAREARIEALTERVDRLQEAVEALGSRTDAPATGRTRLTDAQKLNVVETVLREYYESSGEYAEAYLEILDAIVNDEEAPACA